MIEYFAIPDRKGRQFTSNFRGEMKKYRIILLMVMLIMLIVLPACGPSITTQEAVESPVVEQPVIEEATQETQPDLKPTVDEPTLEETSVPTAEEPIETPPEEGEIDDEDERIQALISEKIGGCHVLNFILSKNKTREEWSTTIDRMIGKGAQVNAEEKELIIDWLVSRND